MLRIYDRRIHLCDAVISDADLSYTNFSDATLTKATIQGCKKFGNLVCHNANFNGIIMDNSDKELSKYLKDHYAMNITEEPGVQSIVSHKVINVFASGSESSCKDVPTS